VFCFNGFNGVREFASVGFGWLVDDVWACAKAELVMGVDI